MNNMDYINLIKKSVIRSDKQGYAMYFKFNDFEYSECKNVLNIDDEKKEDITLDSHFRLASVSKQFIACGIINLVLKGELSFDTCIRDLYPQFPKYFEKIKLINLLNHTSGIYDYEDWEHEEDAPQVLDREIIDFLVQTDGTYFEPGTKYQYSNTAYVLMADIIEDISGMKLAKYMEEVVFKPAGLNDTYVNYQGITKIPHRAYGHLLNDDGSIVMKDQYWCSATIGDGGLYSSINDLKKWIDFYLSDKASYLYDTMFTKQMETEKNNYYGMGMRTVVLKNGKEFYYHCGSTIGTNTILLFSKDYDIRCIFLTNLGNTDTAKIKNVIADILNNTK